MEALEQQIGNFSQFFTPALYVFAISIIALESFLFVNKNKNRDKLSRWLSIACGFFSFGFGYLFYIGVMYYAQSYLYQFRLFEMGFVWYAWVICFLVNDMMFYISHRLEHEVRLFWCVHTVHHSAKQYDLTTGVRGSVFDAVFHFPFYVWLPLIGIHPLIYPIMDTAFKFIGLAYHTETINKMGFLDKILVTPSNHRVHHGSDVKYLDRNYSGFFIFWDKLFGSYQKEEEKPRYGIRKELNQHNIFSIQLKEFNDLWVDVKSALTFKDKVKYLLMPPGWRHEGKVETAKELRRLENGMSRKFSVS